MIARVVLIGFSGTGKSTVGAHAARLLGWNVLDTDSEIERRAGMSVPEIFETQGEAAFRSLERAVLLEGLHRREVIIASGGGAVCTDEIWQALRHDPETLVVRFDAPPKVILQRLESHRAQVPAGQTTRRPMLDADDPLGRIVQLMAEREKFYARAHVTLPVDRREPERTAADIVELVSLGSGIASEIVLDLPNARSRIAVGHGIRSTVPMLLKDRWAKAQRAWIAADAGVHAYHAGWCGEIGSQAGKAADIHIVASGESSKSLAGLSNLYDWMIDGGVERGDVAVAVGGGVTGDLMGFAAATVLRGIGLMQVPTTLLSMVDSSVGGKTGINHPGGKNLIGAFYQPSLVVVDPAFLVTLPERELRSGFAEIIKHGVIQASTPGGENGFLYGVLERNSGSLLRLEEPLTSWVIRQNIALKAAVVREDERESRLRAILNFGHTIGHGIEAAGYSLLHGEAIAVGMIAAMRIGVEKGLVAEAEQERLVRLIEAYGLPVRARFDRDVVRQKMTHDKKKASGAQQWILPEADGGVQIRTDVGDSEIESAIDAVLER